MKKNKWFGLALVAAMTGFSACTNDAEEVLAQESEIKLTSEITPSRVTDPNLQSTQIVEGQQVGVTITGGKSEHNNIAWNVDADGILINTGETIYWGNEQATITAYHPYRSSWNTDGTISFYTRTDQSKDEDYLASDLLWTSVTTNKTQDAIPLTFAHKLSKINVTLTSEDIDDLSNASVYICGTKTSTTFNPSTGELSALSTAKENSIKAGTTTSSAKSVSAIIIPQSVTANTSFIEVVLGGKTYKYTLISDTKFESGNSYNYTLNIKEKLIEMSMYGSTITTWIDNDCGNIEAEESYNITAVDLGLSVKWGSCNLGARRATGRGDYFAWGEITPRNNFTQESYQYWDKETSNYKNIGNEISGTEYDPATAILGEGWRMPTKEECEELINGCTSHATSTSGTTYYFVFTSKSNGNVISFGGYGAASPIVGNGNYGAYFMSSTLSNDRINLIEVTADYHKATAWDRHWGYQIRPVYDED